MDLARAVVRWAERYYAGLLGLAFFALRSAAVRDRGPFVDESFYSLVPRFEVGYVHYLTGNPRLWPPIAAAAWELGGVEAARLLTAGALAVVVFLVAQLAERSCPDDLPRGARRVAGAVAAVLFATSSPALYLSVVATYDAMALLLAASGLCLYVLGADHDRAPLSWLGGLAVAMAGITRYRYLAFGVELLPFVLAHAWRRRRLRHLPHALVPALVVIAGYLLARGAHVHEALLHAQRAAEACCGVPRARALETALHLLSVPLVAAAVALALALAKAWRARRDDATTSPGRWVAASLALSSLPTVGYHVAASSAFTLEKNAIVPALTLSLLSGCVTGNLLRAPAPRAAPRVALAVAGLLAALSLATSPVVDGPLSRATASAAPALLRDWPDVRAASRRLAVRVDELGVGANERVWCLDASNPWELRRQVGVRVYDGRAWDAYDPTAILEGAREAGAPVAVGFLTEPSAVGRRVRGYRVLEALELDRSHRGRYYILALEPAAD